MSITWHSDTSTTDRAMTPDAIAAEITLGAKDRYWVMRMAPADCRWAGPKTRPPLFSEQRIRAWWTGERKSA